MPHLSAPNKVRSRFHQHVIDVYKSRAQGGPKATQLRAPEHASRRSRAHRKYFPHAVTEADKLAWEHLKARYGSNTSTRDRVDGDYGVFLRASNLEPSDESLGWFLGQMSQRLAASSCDSYIKHVLAANRIQGAKTVKKVAEAYNADTIGKHAPDIEIDILHKYIELAHKKLQPILWLLLITGLRVKDLSRLRRRQIHRNEKFLKFLLCLTKGRRRRSLRCILSIPTEWFEVIPQSVEDLLSRTASKKNKRIFQDLEATKINTKLRAMSVTHNLPRPTTYSFRRNYMNLIVEKCGANKDLQAQFTKHISVSITEAHYVKFEEDPELESGSSDGEVSSASERDEDEW